MNDKHALSRDRKRANAERSRLMRGNRSVFVMAAAQAKRDAKAVSR